MMTLSHVSESWRRLGGVLVGRLVSALFSAVSIWEIAIKSALGKARFHYSLDEITDGDRVTGFIELPIYSEHAAQVVRLPLHHHDPFDRLLVAQALTMPVKLVTADAALVPYSALVEREAITGAADH